MSKGLEALEKVEDFFIDYGSFDETGEYKTYISLYQTPEYQVIRKELKALEIIKNKNFDLFYLQDSKDLEQYNDCCDIHRNLCYLTQEEYDLLKEVLS